jgi:hypothetical protein
VQTAENPELALAEDMGRFFYDPLGFVLYAYPWGEGELRHSQGPRQWQRDFLEEIGRRVRENDFDGETPVDPIQEATSSGHGIGKSALTAWIVDWIMSTRPFARGVVTANTGPQLEGKTWAEIAKWTRLCITSHWWQVSTGKGAMKMVHRAYPDSWRCDAQTCRKENSEAFAGLHAANSTPFYIFDEASAIPDEIWEVASGGLTDGEPMWFVFGNPTKNTGRFRECFGKLRHRWGTRQIDSRDVEGTNKDLFYQWIADWGEDSDYVRVRVKGQFPRASSMQFIASDIVEDAQAREGRCNLADPLIIGVDVARFGDDQSVVRVRRGRDAKTWPIRKFRGLDTMQLASQVVGLANELKQMGTSPDAIIVDGGGVGGGVVDRLRQLGWDPLEANFGGESPDVKYANLRAYMWGTMRDWLKEGGAIENDQELYDDLIGVEYTFTPSGNKIQLEKKEDMKKRGLASPDNADGLAVTFAFPVAPRDEGADEGWDDDCEIEYDPFAD